VSTPTRSQKCSHLVRVRVRARARARARARVRVRVIPLVGEEGDEQRLQVDVIPRVALDEG
jgi:hypothetical protein